MTHANMPHPGHDKHLCYLINLRFQETSPEDYKTLIKNAQFFCLNCGRSAADSKNLCNPVKL